MNIFKRTLTLITATIATVSMGVCVIAHSLDGEECSIFPTSDTYTSSESNDYYWGCYNSGDTSWKINTQYKRHKNSDSSIYIKNDGSGYGTVTFWGLKNDTYKYCCSSMNGNQFSGSFKPTGSLSPNSEYWIINYVNERNCSYACIRAHSFEADASNNFYGVWSPDCKGEYPVCNKR